MVMMRWINRQRGDDDNLLVLSREAKKRQNQTKAATIPRFGRGGQGRYLRGTWGRTGDCVRQDVHCAYRDVTSQGELWEGRQRGIIIFYYNYLL